MGGFTVVKMTYGSGDNAKERYSYIADGIVNKSLKQYWDTVEERKLTHPSPSTITTCPMVVWLDNHNVKHTNVTTYAKKQRFSLGRVVEGSIAEALQHSGVLLAHWDDNDTPELVINGTKQPVEKLKSKKFPLLEGVPDYLLNIDGKVAISDAKTARSDSYGYVPIDDTIWDDEFWFNKRMQLTGYYILCYENREFFEYHNLPLPTMCHIFSYALDDGLVRREFMWQPTQTDIDKFTEYYNRFMLGLSSERTPNCTCSENETKFCKYGIEKKGQVYVSCCADWLAN